MMITFSYQFKDINGHVTSEVSATCHEESLPEVIQSFRYFLLGIGFQPESVDNYIEAD